MNQFGRLISSVLAAGWQQFPAIFSAVRMGRKKKIKKTLANQ
jgi:hypothetical protein